jgi:hypothetical protein
VRDGPAGEDASAAAAGHGEFLHLDIAAFEKLVDDVEDHVSFGRHH